MISKGFVEEFQKIAVLMVTVPFNQSFGKVPFGGDRGIPRNSTHLENGCDLPYGSK